jgi:hypothetical protein
MHMVWHNFQSLYLNPQFIRFLMQEFFQVVGNATGQHPAAVLRTPDQVIFKRKHATGIAPVSRIGHAMNITQDSIFVNYIIKKGAASSVA